MAAVRQQLIRNVFSSWFAYALRIGITFFFVPYIASVLGDSRYGVWVIVFQTVAYFSLLDAGLTSALTRYVSRFLSDRNFDQINRILNTANLLSFIVGGLVMLGVWSFVTFFFDIFKIADPALVQEGKAALLILGGFMAFNFIALPFGNSLGAFHRYDILNAVIIGEEIVRTLLMVFLLSRGHGLVALAIVLVILTVVRHLLAAGLLLKLFPELDISRGYIEKQTARTLFSYSKISLGISLCWLLIFNTDAVLLGVMGSAAAAGVFNPAAQLMRYLRNLVNAAATPLIPAVSHKEAQGDLRPVRDLYLKAVRYVAYLSFALAAGVIVYAESFVNLWLPPEFSEAARAMQVLAAGTAFLLPQIIGNSILFGIGKHSRLLVVLLIESVAKVALSILLIPSYGLLGMAAAVSIPQIILYTTLYPYLIGKTLAIPYFRILRITLFAGTPALILSLAVTSGLHWAVEPVTWTRFFIGVIALLAAVLTGAWFIAAEEDRARVRAWFS